MSGGVKSRKKLVIVAISAVMFALLAGGSTWLIMSKNSSHSPFDKKFTNSVSFPLYYPSSLPSGYILDKKSVGSDGTTAYYRLMASDKKLAINVTMQSTPITFDIPKIIGSNPIPTTITPSGTLYNLSIGGSIKYMIDTGATLIFITSETKSNIKDITAISNSLSVVN